MKIVSNNGQSSFSTESSLDFRSSLNLFTSNVLVSISLYFREGGGTFKIWDFKLTAVSLWRSDIPVTVTQVFLKYDFLLVIMRFMQLGLPLKQVVSLIRCSRLKASVKCCNFLYSGVILKSPNNVMFSKLSRYLERFFDIFSKIKELFWLGDLYKPTMSHFLNRMFGSFSIVGQF